MDAGILSYQLCDRLGDCESCPLDAAMRRRIAAPAAAGAQADLPLPSAAPEDLPGEGNRYSRSHWWARKSGRSVIRIGIEPCLAQALQGLKGVVFPPVRQRLTKGQTCVWVVIDGGTLPLEAPVGGVVRGVNHELIAKPHLLSLDPLDEGWLCEMEVDDPGTETAGMMSADAARTKYGEDRSRFVTALAAAVRGKRPAVGVTLADGGERLQNYADMLGPARYLPLVRQAFGLCRK
jgi:glycine cleavage system H protein